MDPQLRMILLERDNPTLYRALKRIEANRRVAVEKRKQILAARAKAAEIKAAQNARIRYYARQRWLAKRNKKEFGPNRSFIPSGRTFSQPGLFNEVYLASLKAFKKANYYKSELAKLYAHRNENRINKAEFAYLKSARNAALQEGRWYKDKAKEFASKTDLYYLQHGKYGRYWN